LVGPSGFTMPAWPCPMRTFMTHVAPTVPRLVLR
jgi:hypothetical protein